MQLKHVTDGGMEAEPPFAGGYGSLGAKHPAAGRFFVIFGKKMTILMRFGPHFARFQSHLKEQNFRDLKASSTNHSLYFRSSRKHV